MKYSETVVICPICGSIMDKSDEVFSDSIAFCMATCPNCQFGGLLNHMDDPEIMTDMVNFYLRTLLEQIAQGEKAKDTINNYPIFSGGRTEILTQLMSQTVPSPTKYPGNKPLPAMNPADIDIVIKVLD